MKVREAEPLHKLSKQRHQVNSEHFSVTFEHIWHKHVLSSFLLHFRKELCAFSWLHMHAAMYAELILLSPCRKHTWPFFFIFSHVHMTIAEATECRGFVFMSLCCWLSSCLSIKGRIHWAHCSKLRRLDWPRYLCVHNSCSSNNNTLSASLDSLLMWKWGNNELLQGYLCVSPCHDCVSCTANLIRRDKFDKMFSDFLHLLLLWPQIDFGSGCGEEIISGFSSCRDFVGEVCKLRLCQNFANIGILIFHL